MAVVITIAQQKGGAGKTMLAANLAAAFAISRRVALLDIDPQRSLTRWHALRTGQAGAAAIAFSDVAGWRLAGELERLRDLYDTVIIDSPPHLDADARRAVRSAHLVLVPVQPCAPDLWAAEGTFAIALAEKRPASFVVNRISTTPQQRIRALAEVRATGHATLAAALGNRASFAQSFAKGLGVIEAAPRTAAASEMRDLSAEIERMLRS